MSFENSFEKNVKFFFSSFDQMNRSIDWKCIKQWVHWYQNRITFGNELVIHSFKKINWYQIQSDIFFIIDFNFKIEIIFNKSFVLNTN
jgi:predicted double-glycine peptidase